MPESGREYHKPVRRSGHQLDRTYAAGDPAEASRVAHATATALLTRVRDQPADDIVERVIGFTDAHGIDTIAELWSASPSKSLPGALWRLYLLQLSIHDDPTTAALLYDRGRAALASADEAIAGAPNPAGPDELVGVIDSILRGVFTGDFAVALDRAAAFCRVQASGAADLADGYDDTEPNRASTLTTRALRLSTYAEDLSACAGLWRRGELA